MITFKLALKIDDNRKAAERAGGMTCTLCPHVFPPVGETDENGNREDCRFCMCCSRPYCYDITTPECCFLRSTRRAIATERAFGCTACSPHIVPRVLTIPEFRWFRFVERTKCSTIAKTIVKEWITDAQELYGGY